jgi:hypothetical protein
MKALSSPLMASGVHAANGATPFAVWNWMFPFELTRALTYGIE